MDITMHVPAQSAAWLAETARRALAGGGTVRIGKTTPVLDIASLKCLNFSLAGSGEHVRCPLVVPLVNVRSFAFERSAVPPHLLPGVDWLVLGGGEPCATLLHDVARHAGPGGAAITVRPFLSLRGPLPQQPAPGDVDFALAKSSANFNQPGWQKNHRRLMTLPEERWHEVGIANTEDLFHLYEPLLDRLLPREPRLILDLGCGLGQLARTLALRYPKARVVGLDSSAEAIAVGQHAFRLPNLSLAAADFGKPLGFAPGSVDLIVSANALPYAPNQRATARELFALLRPDGLLLNYCRAEESHLLWDFPVSLALPTNTQIFLADWLEEAKAHGWGTEVASVPLGMTSAYYRASPAPVFRQMLDALAATRQVAAPEPYNPWSSHVLLAHSASAAPADEGALPLASNHFARLEQVLRRMPEAPAQYQEALVCSWYFLAKGLKLFPELLDFCLAAMPGAGPVLSAMLGPALAQNRQAA